MSLPNAFHVLMGKQGERVTEEEWTRTCQKMAKLLSCFRAYLNFQELRRQKIQIFDSRTISTVDLRDFSNAILKGHWLHVNRKIHLSPQEMAKIEYLGEYDGEPARWRYAYRCWGIDEDGTMLLINFVTIIFQEAGPLGYLKSAEVTEATAEKIVEDLELDPKELYDELERVLRAVRDRRQAEVKGMDSGLAVFAHQNFLARQRNVPVPTE